MKNFLKKFNYTGKTLHVTEKYKIWFTLPAVMLGIGIICFIIFAIIGGSFSSGFNLGIDFTGGTILSVELGQMAEGELYKTNAAKIEEVVSSKGMNIGYTQVSGTGLQAAIVLKYQGNVSEEEMKGINTEISNEIKALYPEISEANETFVSMEYIGATASKDLIGKAFLSIFITGIAMLLYIILRFEIYSGLTAVIALMHDVLIIIAFVIVTRIQLNSNFIAVIITIISYSINNTIVIFDRVRENLVITPVSNRISYSDIVNKSITETIGRSVNTTITTMLTITVLAVMSVPVIREFSLMIIVGLVAGTFSSLCIAPTIYSLVRDRRYQKTNASKYTATQAKKA